MYIDYLQKNYEVAALTWVSDINSVIMSGFKPVLLSESKKSINKID